MYQILFLFVAMTTIHFGIKHMRQQNNVSHYLALDLCDFFGNFLLSRIKEQSDFINLERCRKNIKIFIINLTFLLKWKTFDRKIILMQDGNNICTAKLLLNHVVCCASDLLRINSLIQKWLSKKYLEHELWFKATRIALRILSSASFISQTD